MSTSSTNNTNICKICELNVPLPLVLMNCCLNVFHQECCKTHIDNNKCCPNAECLKSATENDFQLITFNPPKNNSKNEEQKNINIKDVIKVIATRFKNASNKEKAQINIISGICSDIVNSINCSENLEIDNSAIEVNPSLEEEKEEEKEEENLIPDNNLKLNDNPETLYSLNKEQLNFSFSTENLIENSIQSTSSSNNNNTTTTINNNKKQLNKYIQTKWQILLNILKDNKVTIIVVAAALIIICLLFWQLVASAGILASASEFIVGTFAALRIKAPEIAITVIAGIKSIITNSTKKKL